MTVQAGRRSRRSATTSPSRWGAHVGYGQHTAPYRRRPLPRSRDGSWRLISAGIICLGCLSGVASGVGAAALALALVNKAVTALTVEQAEVLLVAGPLAGLLPVSFLLLGAGRNPRVARLLPAALGLWLACGVAAFVWLGFSPQVR